MAPSTEHDDSLADRLRALPPFAPDANTDAAVMNAARAALDGRAEDAAERGWFGRAVVPIVLSATTLSYLWWAVMAASSLYS